MYDRLRVAADNWMNRNPVAMSIMLRYARQAKESGMPRIGMQMLIERTRWYGVVELRDADFKINNNHAAYIARRLMFENFDLDGFFTTRESERMRNI
jgi:hypothetical protein